MGLYHFGMTYDTHFRASQKLYNLRLNEMRATMAVAPHGSLAGPTRPLIEPRASWLLQKGIRRYACET